MCYAVYNTAVLNVFCILQYSSNEYVKHLQYSSIECVMHLQYSSIECVMHFTVQ
jgi:hypothetical protein